jgi:3'-5' exoribonuclease 1
MIEQQFEYIAVVDFEATCEEKQRNNYRHEIIEFPIVLINVQEQTIVNYVNQIKLITNHFFSD